MLGDCNRLTASGRNPLRQGKGVAVHAKYRHITAARIDSEKKRAVLAESQRSLRAERIGVPATAAAAGCKSSRRLQRAIRRPLELKNFIFVGRVRHYEHRASFRVLPITV